ncbi:MAG TPA: ester cyclase [Actinomycetota bacterium]|nr:ester cyclase [Actinomycetota bacterium]
MSGGANREVYGGVIEAISRGDPDALEGLVAPDIVDHNPSPDQPPGINGFKEWIRRVRSSFPDLRGSIETVVAEDDWVAARVTWRGTHRGDFIGLPATNRRVEFEAYHVVRFADGLATEWWGAADLLGAAEQLGATLHSAQE